MDVVSFVDLCFYCLCFGCQINNNNNKIIAQNQCQVYPLVFFQEFLVSRSYVCQKKKKFFVFMSSSILSTFLWMVQDGNLISFFCI